METANFEQFIVWTFYGVVSFSAIFGVKVLTKLTQSIDQLNIKMAEILQTSAWHEKTLDRHENKIQDLKETIAFLQRK